MFQKKIYGCKRLDHDSLFTYRSCLFPSSALTPLGASFGSLFMHMILACCAVCLVKSTLIQFIDPALQPLLSTRRQNTSLPSLTSTLKPSYLGSSSSFTYRSLRNSLKSSPVGFLVLRFTGARVLLTRDKSLTDQSPVSLRSG